MKESILVGVPIADIKVRQFRGQPLEVTVSFLDFNRADPAMMSCLPESERWHMAPKVTIFKAPQSELYKKYPDLRHSSMQKIASGCRQTYADWLPRPSPKSS